MFDTVNLLMLLLAPVIAYMTGAMLFFGYGWLHKNTARPF
ncbi:MAG: hypothetical protein ACI96W_003815 [Paraglaciecola sp.]|jgi:hypothetical protein